MSSNLSTTLRPATADLAGLTGRVVAFGVGEAAAAGLTEIRYLQRGVPSGL